MTCGASTTAAAPAAASVPPAFTRNRRRFTGRAPYMRRNEPGPSRPVAPSPRHELMIGAFGDVVPRPHQRLELCVGRVHLPGHRRLLRLLPDDVGRQLPELAQHRGRELEDLHLVLELRPKSLKRGRVLHVEVAETVDLDR